MGYKETVVEKFAAGVEDLRRARWPLFIEDGVLYSYGHHFPLAIRKGDVYLINGDKYSVTTSSHQSAAIQGLKPNVQVPFSALNAAGIGPHGVEIVDHTPDRVWYECPLTGREVRETRGDSWTYTWSYVDTGEPCPETLEDGKPYDGLWRHQLGAVVLKDSQGRHWLSGMDENEDNMYFLTRLPRKSPTVADAYEALAPKIVRDAWAEGVEVKRQGDVFLIPADVDTRDLPAPSEKWAPVFTGSTHVATEVRRNGKDYVRGTVRHRPQLVDRFREPEHKMVTLGNTWHIAMPNRALESYSATGDVD